MRICVGSLREINDDDLRFAAQLGVTGVVFNTPVLTGQAPYGSNAMGATYWNTPGADRPRQWDFLELLHLKERVNRFGLQLAAIENVPLHFYESCILGLPDRDAQIESYCATIRAVGRAGIPVLGYHWMANRVWRTSKSHVLRGGATTSAFDLRLAERAPLTHGRIFTSDEIWRNYVYFMNAVLPVAKSAGVILALHPDDPPVEQLGGVARIFRGFGAIRRAIEDVAPGENHMLDFCMGTWAEMGVATMLHGLRHFVPKRKVAYIHFRNVRGCVPTFEETFIDDGDVDAARVMALLDELGFDGFLIDDHVPHMIDDTLWMHRGRAYAVGYMTGLLHATRCRSREVASEGS